MYSLKVQAQTLMSTSIEGQAGNAGPRFLWSPSPSGATKR
jgi:hypothetical protein